MTRPILPLALVLAVLAGAVAPLPAAANPIQRACLQSDREAATPSLCACIGSAAERTLTRSQMREGARFFQDPQRAQDVRQSDRRNHEELWQAWRNFGETAEAMCS
ncbi:hypothetical protein [Roseicyclus persicicus]|uniref:Arginine transporter n=1 Tax=Roseicyclus persicicus TaxID=2650661 RepID=A0A7X6GW20_9RHOB|nr:hypothetical protein [Roseibacterium persicicum]NKX43411.1 hypothetical protein [Roseibacterium persicicum]